MKMLRRVLIVLAVVLLLPVTARAADCRLTLIHHHENEALPNAVYDLYLLDEEYEDGLAAYNAVVKAGTLPDYTTVTDSNGVAVFENLETGNYLLVGHPHKISDTQYCLGEKTLISLPYPDDDGNPLYDVRLKTKHELENIGEIIRYEVIKIWKDTGSTSKRPVSVKVELYRNQVLYETVVLTGGSEGTSAGANWRYSWTDTDPSAVWTVVEQVPDGYKVKYEREGNTFTVTNTRQTPPPSPPDEPGKPKPPKLPQTGQVWWPVPVLVLLGSILMLAGWRVRKESWDER